MCIAIARNEKPLICTAIEVLREHFPEIFYECDISKPCASQYLLGLYGYLKMVNGLDPLFKHDPMGDDASVQAWRGDTDVEYEGMLYLLFRENPEIPHEIIKLLQKYANLRKSRIVDGVAHHNENNLLQALRNSNNPQINQILSRMTGEGSDKVVFPCDMGWVSAAWNQYPVGLSPILKTMPDCVAKLRRGMEEGDKTTTMQALKSLDMILRSMCCLISGMIDSQLIHNVHDALEHFLTVRAVVQDFMALYPNGLGDMYKPWLVRLDRLISLARGFIDASKPRTLPTSHGDNFEQCFEVRTSQIAEDIYYYNAFNGFAPRLFAALISQINDISIELIADYIAVQDVVHAISYSVAYNPNLAAKIVESVLYSEKMSARSISELSSGNIAPRQQTYVRAKSPIKIRSSKNHKQIFAKTQNALMLLLAFLAINFGFAVV